MRQDVPPVDVIALDQLAHVMAEVHAASLVIVDAMDLTADLLQETDRRAVADPKVPGGRNRHVRIIGHVRNAPIALELLDDGAVIAADHHRLETAKVFLVEDRLAVIWAMQALEIV